MSQETHTARNQMPVVNRYVQALCGLYSRVARQMNVDRSYVSRVARGERRSDKIEHALLDEFSRITQDQPETSPANQNV